MHNEADQFYNKRRGYNSRIIFSILLFLDYLISCSLNLLFSPIVSPLILVNKSVGLSLSLSLCVYAFIFILADRKLQKSEVTWYLSLSPALCNHLIFNSPYLPINFSLPLPTFLSLSIQSLFLFLSVSLLPSVPHSFFIFFQLS